MNAIAVRNGAEIEHDTRTTARVVESLVLRGDISALSPEERAKYYISFCEQLGLNPATQPLALLRLNGKEILYPTRGATDQLAAIHRLNREIIDGPKIMDLGGTKLVYAVCRATHPNGRTETAVATVPLTDPVNVLMKCETKAKRRATLSILGLGMLDETEIESIPAAAKETAAPINLGAVTAKHIENERRSEEPTVLDATDAYRRALQLLEPYTVWTCAALWIEWEPTLREEVESETLHDLQMEAKGCAPDATSMAAWKFAVDATLAAKDCEEVRESLQTHVLSEVGGDFVASWRVYKAAVAKLPENLRKLCWELHWRGYNRVCNVAKGEAAFRKALGGDDVPPDGTKGRTRGEALAASAEGGEAGATADAPQASVSYLVPLSESQRYVASADEWRAHCAGYKHREHAVNSWAKHCAAFRAAGDAIYRARLQTAAERLQALVNALDAEVCKLAFVNAERTAAANARRHAEHAVRKAG